MDDELCISEKAINLARDLQSEMIDCGMDMCRMMFESSNWTLDAKSHLTLFCVDANNKTHLWKEGN